MASSLLLRVHRRLQAWMVNEGPAHIFFAIWVVINAIAFNITFNYYNSSDDFRTIRSYTGGWSLGVSRGAAVNINIAGGLLLVPVCRNIISLLRGSALGRFVPFDRNIDFHKTMSMSMCFWAVVHIFGHGFNIQNYSLRFPGSPSSLKLASMSGVGVTGHVMTVALFLLATSAVATVRRRAFETFWCTHHIAGLTFYVLCLVHGSFCFITSDIPHKKCTGPNFYKYIIPAVVLYIAERIIRAVRARQETKITKVIIHPGKVVEVQMKKDSACTRAGQYVFLNCPELGILEWHPFTLTSAPEEGYLSVHIRVVGDWTTKMASRLGCDWEVHRMSQLEAGHALKDHSTVVGNSALLVLPRVMLDGPYGAAAEDVLNFKVAVCIAAGIGVTPFASVLKSIWYRVMVHPRQSVPEKVYFIWICRETMAVEWFYDLLRAIEEDNIDQFVEFSIYYTGGLNEEQISNVMINHEYLKKSALQNDPTIDVLTGLRSPTFIGRPNIESILSGVNKKHPNTDAGVFFCGPSPLGKSIKASCIKYTSFEENGTRFYFNKENF